MAAKCEAIGTRGKPCAKYAMPGKTVCGYHGGAFTDVPADGQPRLEDGSVDVRALVARWGNSPGTRPAPYGGTDMRHGTRNALPVKSEAA